MNSIMQQLMMGKPKTSNPFKMLLEDMGALPKTDVMGNKLPPPPQQQPQQGPPGQGQSVQPNPMDMMQAMRGMQR